MPVIQIAYTVGLPVLLLLIWRNKSSKVWLSLLAVSNLLLLVFSFTVAKQLWGWYQALKSFRPIDAQTEPVWNLHLTALLLVLLMPWAFLFRKMRTKSGYSFLLWSGLIYAFPPAYWNTYDLFIRLLMYGCLFCSAYALLWLLKQLPVNR